MGLTKSRFQLVILASALTTQFTACADQKGGSDAASQKSAEASDHLDADSTTIELSQAVDCVKGSAIVFSGSSLKASQDVAFGKECNISSFMVSAPSACVVRVKQVFALDTKGNPASIKADLTKINKGVSKSGAVDALDYLIKEPIPGVGLRIDVASDKACDSGDVQIRVKGSVNQKQPAVDPRPTPERPMVDIPPE